MPKTYDQTSITYRKDKCELHHGPRPVPPCNAKLEADSVIRAHMYENREICPLYYEWKTTEYEWYPDGMVTRNNDDGSTTTWYPKPTIKDAAIGGYIGLYFRFYPDGSCMVRYHDGVEQRTLFYDEDREVDEPDQDNWVNSNDIAMGRQHPDLIPEGWYCKKCDTHRCHHIAEEKKKQTNNESP
jgi:hypothetical protein